MKYDYPLLECDHHPGPQPGYVICIHVLTDEKPAKRIVKPGAHLGEILCAECDHLATHSKSAQWAKIFKPICQSCAIENGHIGIAT